jgi:hypothetical protein
MGLKNKKSDQENSLSGFIPPESEISQPLLDGDQSFISCSLPQISQLAYPSNREEINGANQSHSVLNFKDIFIIAF